MHLRHVGWVVGVTYGTSAPGGLTKRHFDRLLAEMHRHDMNLLALMMVSYAYYDPRHDGFCWPVSRPRLQALRDPTAINADPTREFLPAVLADAWDRGIEVELFLNWGIWNPARVAPAYPDARRQQTRQGTSRAWLYCPDSPGAWQLGLDAVADLLTRYDHEAVTRFACERVGYQGAAYCHCPDTRAAFAETRGHAGAGPSLEAARPAEVAAWKVARATHHLRAMVDHVHAIRPDVAVGLHTQGNLGWGHDPARFPGAGISFVEPHTIQHRTRRRAFHRTLRHLVPNPCTLHVCARDQSLPHYPLWRKTPKTLHKFFRWLRAYPGGNVEGLLFFNEPAVSAANRAAIYGELGQF